MRRRDFLKTGGLAFASAFMPLPGLNISWAANKSRKRIIYVFLRGGQDILTLLPPSKNQVVGASSVHALRPDLAVPTIADLIAQLKDVKKVPSDLQLLGAAVGLTDPSVDDVKAQLSKFKTSTSKYIEAAGANYAFHPGMIPLREAMDAGELSIITHTGSRHETRSHFSQQDLIECGSAKAVQGDGIFSRLMKSNAAVTRDRQALALGAKIPRSLRGFDAALVDTVQDVAAKMDLGKTFKSQLGRDERLQLFKTNDPSDVIATKVSGATRLAEDLAVYEESLKKANSTSAVRRRFTFASELVKQTKGSEFNPAVITADIWGWDTHNKQGSGSLDVANLGGKMMVVAEELAHLRTSLQASGEWNNTMVVVMSEFGRTIAQNGSLGTDHGRGSAMLLMGPGLKVKHGSSTWDFSKPDDGGAGLSSAALEVKIDYRDVLAEVIEKHLGVSNINRFFAQDYSPTKRSFLG